MELKLKKKFGKLLVILQNYLTVNYRKLLVTLLAIPTLVIGYQPTRHSRSFPHHLQILKLWIVPRTVFGRWVSPLPLFGTVFNQLSTVWKSLQSTMTMNRHLLFSARLQDKTHLIIICFCQWLHDVSVPAISRGYMTGHSVVSACDICFCQWLHDWLVPAILPNQADIMASYSTHHLQKTLIIKINNYYFIIKIKTDLLY